MTAARRSLSLALLAALLTAVPGAGASTLELYGIEGPPELGGSFTSAMWRAGYATATRARDDANGRSSAPTAGR
jgi:hypothetical protein